MRKIRVNDQVVIITGKDKGKRGTVTRVYDEGKVLVQGINVLKKHQKPNPSKGMTGGVIEKNCPIAISNVALFNPTTKKGDRVGFRLLADGRKVRFFKSNNEIVDN